MLAEAENLLKDEELALDTVLDFDRGPDLSPEEWSEVETARERKSKQLGSTRHDSVEQCKTWPAYSVKMC